MYPHDPDDLPHLETDGTTNAMTRRTLLRRSIFGTSGLILAPLLVACGGEEDDEDAEDAVDEVNNPPDAPEVDPDDPGMDAPNDDVEDDGPDEEENEGD